VPAKTEQRERERDGKLDRYSDRVRSANLALLIVTSARIAVVIFHATINAGLIPLILAHFLWMYYSEARQIYDHRRTIRQCKHRKEEDALQVRLGMADGLEINMNRPAHSIAPPPNRARIIKGKQLGTFVPVPNLMKREQD